MEIDIDASPTEGATRFVGVPLARVLNAITSIKN